MADAYELVIDYARGNIPAAMEDIYGDQHMNHGDEANAISDTEEDTKLLLESVRDFISRLYKLSIRFPSRSQGSQDLD